jgi:hypothetical protein
MNQPRSVAVAVSKPSGAMLLAMPRVLLALLLPP